MRYIVISFSLLLSMVISTCSDKTVLFAGEFMTDPVLGLDYPIKNNVLPFVSDDEMKKIGIKKGVCWEFSKVFDQAGLQYVLIACLQPLPDSGVLEPDFGTVYTIDRSNNRKVLGVGDDIFSEAFPKGIAKRIISDVVQDLMIIFGSKEKLNQAIDEQWKYPMSEALLLSVLEEKGVHTGAIR